MFLLRVKMISCISHDSQDRKWKCPLNFPTLTWALKLLSLLFIDLIYRTFDIGTLKRELEFPDFNLFDLEPCAAPKTGNRGLRFPPLFLLNILPGRVYFSQALHTCLRSCYQWASFHKTIAKYLAPPAFSVIILHWQKWTLVLIWLDRCPAFRVRVGTGLNCHSFEPMITKTWINGLCQFSSSLSLGCFTIFPIQFPFMVHE